MRELSAITTADGARFVEEMQRAWDRGDAVLPVDARLPAPAVEALLRAMRPATLLDGAGERSRLRGALPIEDGDAVVLATSGTTGEPKGVVLSHDALQAAAIATSARLGVDPDRDRWLACIPLAHAGGLSVVTRALLTGTPLTVHSRLDPGDVAAAAAAGCTLVSLVPTALARVGAGAFRKVLLGGSAPPPALPPNVVSTYGMTETGGGVVYDGVPLDGVEVRVVSGEVQLRGPMLLSRYRNNALPRSRSSWLLTGDAGEILPDGRLAVHGRIGDLIITGGENVWPQAVEAVLEKHPGIADVAVHGRPDPEWGQRVVARVVPSDPSAPPTLESVRALVAENLAPFAAPRELELASAIERTALGKIVRRRGKP